MGNDINDLVQLRHWLHAHPEVSGYEKNTAAFVSHFLQNLHPDLVIKNMGGEGILVLFDSGKSGLELLFRCELDALPIREINDFEHRSIIDGVSHKCGHDGHAAILCGLAKKLSEQKPGTGKVYLLFQPAEETGEGAPAIVNDTQFNIQPDYVFALHNLPGFERGTVVVKDGLFSAAVNSMIITLKGKTAHAAEPEFGINPALAISEIISMTDLLNNNNPGDKNFQLVTPVHVSMGSAAYGTAAGEGQLHFTLRCWTNEQLRKLESTIIYTVQDITNKYELQFDYSFLQTFYANNNNEEANNFVRRAAEKCNYSIIENNEPFKWGEDFGYFTSQFRGCMFGLGAGKDHPALHNADYDFPDSIIENGVSIFYTITTLLLNK